MKKFLKVFAIALVVFGIIAAVIGMRIKKAQAETGERNAEINEKWFEETVDKIEKEQEEKIEDKTVEVIQDPLLKAIKESNRINIVVMGLEKDPRTDVIIFASCDPDTKKVDLISVPRDTYLYEEGYENAGHKKINSYYGKKNEDGTMRKAEGTRQAVSEVLGVPVHHYVTVSYSGVEKIIDAIGGITVNVPMRMDYKDPTDKPPLVIDIPKGKQHLDGHNTIGFLRYRHGNMREDGSFEGGYPDGDLGRIRAQQSAIKEVIRKSISLNLPKVVEKTFEAVKTDMTFSDILAYATTFANFNMDDLSMCTLDGDGKYIDKISYFVVDEEALKDRFKEMYGVFTQLGEDENLKESIENSEETAKE